MKLVLVQFIQWYGQSICIYIYIYISYLGIFYYIHNNRKDNQKDKNVYQKGKHKEKYTPNNNSGYFDIHHIVHCNFHIYNMEIGKYLNLYHMLCPCIPFLSLIDKEICILDIFHLLLQNRICNLYDNLYIIFHPLRFLKIKGIVKCRIGDMLWHLVDIRDNKCLRCCNYLVYILYLLDLCILCSTHYILYIYIYIFIYIYIYLP